MSLLEVNGLSHTFSEKQLYIDAGFSLYKGEHMGVVGQNGCGKSTLLKILTGEIIPDKGAVTWKPGLSIGELNQHARIDGNDTILTYLSSAFSRERELEREMEKLYELSAQTGLEEPLQKASEYQERLEASGYYEAQTEIDRVITGLGLDALGIESRLSHLSGGQRTKVILAKLLLERPEILLLDEPTNFLDRGHINWLSGYLSAFPGAYLVISHDPAFLNAITTCILDVDFQTIRKFNGRYEEYLRQKKHQNEEQAHRYAAQASYIARTEEYIRKNKAGVNSKMARGRQKQLDRLERVAPPSTAPVPSFTFPEIPLPAQTALRAQDLEIGYDSPLLPKLSFSVSGGEKLVITGFNGIGKSTLIKTLIGFIPSLSGVYTFSDPVAIGYYSQGLRWESPALTPLQILCEEEPSLIGNKRRGLLARCGVRADCVDRPVSTLSGGEQAKVKLAILLLKPINFLILDEPTNHLDADAKAALKRALLHFSGSVILVSHEDLFFRDVADRILPVDQMTKDFEQEAKQWRTM